MYDVLARYYDLFFAAAWKSAAIREQLLKSVFPRVSSACDLCCGTGTTAVDFARRGWRVWAVDRSAGMCRKARENARQAGTRIRVLRADMRSFRLPEPVDLVTCEFDALNHVAEKTDLPAVLHCVVRALRPGGWFYFDVNNRPAFETVWPLSNYFERPGVVAMFHGGCDAEQDRAWSDMEIFEKTGRLWRRHHGRVEEVCWTESEMNEALSAAGFGRVRTWDAARFFRDNPYIGRKHRTYYLARLG